VYPLILVPGVHIPYGLCTPVTHTLAEYVYPLTYNGDKHTLGIVYSPGKNSWEIGIQSLRHRHHCCQRSTFCLRQGTRHTVRKSRGGPIEVIWRYIHDAGS